MEDNQASNSILVASGEDTINSHKYEIYKFEYDGLKSHTAKGRAPRKLQLKSLDVKYKALKEVEKGIISKGQIAKSYGIPANTLSMWIKTKDKIIAAFESRSFKIGCKKMRLAKHGEVENALYEWYRGARAHGIHVSGSLLKSRALEFAAKFGATDFTGSTGWMSHFKERYKIHLKKPFITEEDKVEYRNQESENDESSLENTSNKSSSNTEPVSYFPLETVQTSCSMEVGYNVKPVFPYPNEDTHTAVNQLNKTEEDVTESLPEDICHMYGNTTEKKDIPQSSLGNESEDTDSEVNEIKYSPQSIYPKSLLKVKKTNNISQKHKSSSPTTYCNPCGITPTEVLEMCGKIRLFLLTNHIPDKAEGLDHISGLELIISKLTLSENYH